MRDIDQDGSETQSAVDAIRLLVLTGCRLGEIMTLKRAHADLKARELRLPDSKTGAKIVHFGKTAADVLKGIKKLENNPYVITGKKLGSRLTDLQQFRGDGSAQRQALPTCVSMIFDIPTPAVPSPWEKVCR